MGTIHLTSLTWSIHHPDIIKLILKLEFGLHRKIYSNICYFKLYISLVSVNRRAFAMIVVCEGGGWTMIFVC